MSRYTVEVRKTLFYTIDVDGDGPTQAVETATTMVESGKVTGSGKPPAYSAVVITEDGPIRLEARLDEREPFLKFFAPVGTTFAKCDVDWIRAVCALDGILVRDPYTSDGVVTFFVVGESAKGLDLSRVRQALADRHALWPKRKPAEPPKAAA